MFAQMQGGYNGPSKSDANAVARPFEVRCHLGAMLAAVACCLRARLYVYMRAFLFGCIDALSHPSSRGAFASACARTVECMLGFNAASAGSAELTDDAADADRSNPLSHAPARRRVDLRFYSHNSHSHRAYNIAGRSLRRSHA
jgi:hypothetical protein